jgi:outer membrane protein assembly factor BamB
MGWGGRIGLAKGCAFVSGTGNYLLHGGDLYDIRQPNQERFRQPRANDFKPMLYLGGLTRLQIDRANQKALGEFREPVLTEGAMYCQQDGIAAWDLTQPKIEERAKSEIPRYRKEDQYPDKLKATFPQLWKLASKSKVHIKADGRLYCARAGLVEAIEIPQEGAEPKVSWQAKVQGTPHRMLAADGKLFLVTREGRIYAFGPEERAEPVVHAKPAAPAPEADQWTRRVARLLEATATVDGYVLVLGVGTGRLAEELVRQSRCDVIAVDPDAEKVARLRKHFQRAGLYGSRIAIHAGDPVSCSFPPYVASLIVSEDPALVADAVGRDLVKRLFRSLRPYGGTACLPMPPAKQKALAEAASASELQRAVVRQTDHVVMLTRQGALPDTANWSHNGANAANTGASQDRVVKPPLTRLWFNGSFRWIRTPGTTVVRVAGGRVLIKAGRLDAIDAYTGRHLWQAALPAAHNPGGEIVAVEDAVYLTAGNACVALDPATGKKSGQIDLPEGVEGRWSNVRVAGDLLVGANVKQLICVNRRTGQPVWKQDRKQRIGSIAIGGGKVFAADFVNRRRGQPAPDMSGVTAQAFDLSTGKPLWEITGGTDVRYGQAHDLVVTTGGVYRVGDGSQVRKSGGTWAITDQQQLTGNAAKFAAYDLVTGSPSGKELSWFTRGCTPLRAGAMMLTTRYQGNAAFVDLASGEITSIWNVRAACSNNLFPANGVLNVPNLSGGCTCNYLPISQAFAPSSAFE